MPWRAQFAAERLENPIEELEKLINLSNRISTIPLGQLGRAFIVAFAVAQAPNVVTAIIGFARLLKAA